MAILTCKYYLVYCVYEYERPPGNAVHDASVVLDVQPPLIAVERVVVLL